VLIKLCKLCAERVVLIIWDARNTYFERNVLICPTSNANLSLGSMPLEKYLDWWINIGLGSDVGIIMSYPGAKFILPECEKGMVFFYH